MTQRRSQIVLPINASTLFTTVIGAIIVGFLVYLADLPKKIDSTAVAVEGMAANIKSVSENQNKQWEFINDHTRRIQTIENTRFTRQDAEVLSERTIDEIKSALVPVTQSVSRNERDIMRLEEEYDDLEERINNK